MKPSIIPTGVLVTLALLLTLGLGGCLPRVRFRAEVAPTSLVAVSSGVWVVYDYPEAVFYSDGAYWWWNAGSWYRSGYADSGWVYVQTGFVPARVRSIDRPEVYVRYRASGTRRAVPAGHVTGHYDSGGRGRGPGGEPGEHARGPGGDDHGARGREPHGDDHGEGDRDRGEDRDDGRGRDGDRHHDPAVPTVRVPGPADEDRERGRDREHGDDDDDDDEHGGDAERGRGREPPRATPAPAAPPPAAPTPDAPHRDRRAAPPRSGDDDADGARPGGSRGSRGRRGRGSEGDGPR